jgi:hypothetical protein
LRGPPSSQFARSEPSTETDKLRRAARAAVSWSRRRSVTFRAVHRGHVHRGQVCRNSVLSRYGQRVASQVGPPQISLFRPRRRVQKVCKKRQASVRFSLTAARTGCSLGKSVNVMFDCSWLAARHQRRLALTFLATAIPSVSPGLFGIKATRNDRQRMARQVENEQRSAANLALSQFQSQVVGPGRRIGTPQDGRDEALR